jgi:hypothetical protein
MRFTPDPSDAKGSFEQGNELRSEATAESLDPNDSNLLRDQIKGQTIQHAEPPRFEDEGQSGG